LKDWTTPPIWIPHRQQIHASNCEVEPIKKKIETAAKIIPEMVYLPSRYPCCLILVFCLAILQQIVFASPTDCVSCVSQGNVWCALTNKCASKAELCNAPYNVTWFLVAKETKGQSIPDYCNTGVFTFADQCPTSHLILERGALYSVNLKYPLGRQPRLRFDVNITHDPKDLIVGNYFYEQNVNYTAKPYFFSFSYHVNNHLPVIFDMVNGEIIYTDLSVASEPREYYQIGYGLILPRNKSSSTYQCVFLNEGSKRIWQKADYQWIYEGPHLYVGFPLIILALILVSITFLCCVDKFNVKKHYHDGEELHETLSKRVFISSYAATGKYSLKEILHSLLFAIDSQIIEQCGTDAYYYLWFQKYMIIYVIACMCVSMPILLPLYYYNNSHAISFSDFAGLTIASLDIRHNNKLLITYLVIMIFGLFGCVYLYFLRRLARTLIKPNKNFSSLFTVMVSNLSPKLIKPSDLIAQFRERYGDCIVDAQICYDLRKLTELDNKRDKLTRLLDRYQEIADTTGKSPSVRVGFLWLKKIDALNHFNTELQKVQEKINQISKKSLSGTGYGFVTFSSIKMAQKCLTDHSIKFCGISIPLWLLDNRWDYSVEPAPEADDINYANLSFSSFGIWIRSILTNSIMTVILLTVYAIVYIASLLNWYRDTHQSVIFDFLSKFTIGILLQAFVELIPEIISAITETVKPVLEVLTEFEKHHTRFEYRKSVVRKTGFFMCLTIVILPYVYTYVNGVWRVCFRAKPPFNNYIYYFNYMGIEVITICIVLSTIAKSIELYFVFLKMMFQLWREKKMDRIEYDYDGNYGFKISFMLFMLVFGAITPTMLPFVLFFFVFTYWIDKYLIMFFYERGHESDGRVVNTVADVSSYYISVFPIYILIMLPSLLLVWKTYLILIPFLIVLAIILKRIHRQAKAAEVEKIVIGIKESSWESDIDDGSNIEEDTSGKLHLEEEDASPYTAAPSSYSDATVGQRSGMLSHILSYLRNTSVGPETRLSYDDIENIVNLDHLSKMATRYKHPYLRKQLVLRRPSLPQLEDER
jgi:hypothetical protein